MPPIGTRFELDSNKVPQLFCRSGVADELIIVSVVLQYPVTNRDWVALVSGS